MRLSTLVGTLGAAAVGCTGTIAGEPEGARADVPGETAGPTGATSTTTTTPGAAARCSTAFAVGPAPVRRLTRVEYNNTIRDLLGDSSTPADQFSPDGRMGPFDNNVDAPANPLAANEYMEAAEALATRALSRPGTLVPCATTGLPRDQEDACARSFVRSFGKRAFRRPMTDTEVDRYTKVYADARTQRGRDFAGGVRLVITAMLQSPHFLDHIERGTPTSRPGVYALGPYELASRLSYALWQTAPDDALVAAADGGKLATPADLEREARRMMGDARARAGLWAFYDQLMSLSKLDGLTKDKSFPFFTPALAATMRKETQAMVDSVLWDGDGKLSTLLTASHTFVNATLASSIYGLKNVTGDNLRRTEMNPAERAGILTQPSFLAIQAHADETDPIHRGKFVREQLLCQHMPPPPPDLNPTPPKPDPKQTTRQRYSSMLEIQPCAGCHRLMNLIGLGFESYDAVGRFRTTENGLPIDATGEVIGTEHTDGVFDGARDLGTRLARSPDVRGCMSSTWFSYVIGRATVAEDACSLADLRAAFEASDGNLRDVFLAVIKTDAFRLRSAGTEVCQ